MAKKVLAALCALSVVMSTAAVLPQGAVKLGAAVTASAAETLYDRDFDYTVLDDGTLEVSKYFGEGMEVTISSEVFGKKVTAIGDMAFMGYSHISDITIPDSVTRIGRMAFVDCSISRITIPDSVTDIGYEAYGYCSDIDGTLPMGSCTIYGHSGTAAEKYAIENNIEFIDLDELFELLENGDGVFEISDYRGIDKEITIPAEIDGKKITSIGILAFSYCDSLTSVTIPDSVTSIKDKAFDDCGNLASVTITNGVKSIGEEAFYDCDSLESVTIPKSVTEIGDRAFGYTWDYSNNEFVDVPLEGFTIYGYRGTAAEWYANGNGFEFIPLDKPVENVNSGDCNGDGKTTMKDYSELQKYLSGWDVEIDPEAADLNGDGKVTMKDYAALQRKLNGWS